MRSASGWTSPGTKPTGWSRTSRDIAGRLPARAALPWPCGFHRGGRALTFRGIYGDADVRWTYAAVGTGCRVDPLHRLRTGMMNDRAIFQDAAGRGWLVEVLYGHPAPAERGIQAARFVCPEAPEEPVRLGFVMMDWVAAADEAALRDALAEADPADEIG